MSEIAFIYKNNIISYVLIMYFYIKYVLSHKFLRLNMDISLCKQL